MVRDSFQFCIIHIYGDSDEFKLNPTYHSSTLSYSNISILMVSTFWIIIGYANNQVANCNGAIGAGRNPIYIVIVLNALYIV